MGQPACSCGACQWVTSDKGPIVGCAACGATAVFVLGEVLNIAAYLDRLAALREKFAGDE